MRVRRGAPVEAERCAVRDEKTDIRDEPEPGLNERQAGGSTGRGPESTGISQ